VPTDEGGGRGDRTRPELFPPSTRYMLAVWCAVTLVLVAIYLIVVVVL
jgi:hypothetical protein